MSRRQEGGVIRSARLTERRLFTIRIPEAAARRVTASKIDAGPLRRRFWNVSRSNCRCSVGEKRKAQFCDEKRG
jgi:hypothetical protein